MSSNLQAILEDNPVIAGIKNDAGLEAVLTSDCKIVFILYGNILNIGDIVKKIKASGKISFINVDLLEGLSHKEIVVQYLKEHTKADGILSSKASMIRAARAQGFYTIHRFFLIDSFSFHNLDKQIDISQPDCIEILPGCMPKVISWVIEKFDLPVIAGGLVCEKDDVVAALKAGAVAISSTNTAVWSV
ncbi:glycerol-3-phosphate responsive antiterminator [Sporomusa sp.]|uniref:glycerol-3-phosphate responsive antiterminator n=1 Tax=Sporomusa sp. TaxID=2078658 RepID=UPI002B76616E|nr:glycerol-3-phosphate responsive antiterminator [Sporomusa sp.]HWR45874.1 glycerol-3-phosphate responsive antiterminator [Sporomusa sp.]